MVQARSASLAGDHSIHSDVRTQCGSPCPAQQRFQSGSGAVQGAAVPAEARELPPESLPAAPVHQAPAAAVQQAPEPPSYPLHDPSHDPRAPQPPQSFTASAGAAPLQRPQEYSAAGMPGPSAMGAVWGLSAPHHPQSHLAPSQVRPRLAAGASHSDVLWDTRTWECIRCRPP